MHAAPKFFRRAGGFWAQWIGWLWERVEQTFHPHHWGEGLGALGFHIKEKKVTAAKGGDRVTASNLEERKENQGEGTPDNRERKDGWSLSVREL